MTTACRVQSGLSLASIWALVSTNTLTVPKRMRGISGPSGPCIRVSIELVFNTESYGEEIRLSYYAWMVVIDFYAELKDNMEAKNCPRGRRVCTRPLSSSPNTLEWSKMTRLHRSACHDLYQIYQVLSLHISSWSSNRASIRRWRVSG